MTDAGSTAPSPLSARIEFTARALAVAAAFGFLAVLAWCVVQRIGYRYELEWMEGAMLRIASRAASGQPLYVEPTIDFTMSVYAPLYFWIAGLAQAVLGGGFLGPRLVSVVALCATLFLILRFAGREGRYAGAAWVGAGFYAATYGIGDAYHDTVHVDSLFVMWLVAAFYVLRFWRGVAGAAVCGLLLALAFMTKQSGLLALLLVPVAAGWMRGLRQGLLVAALAIGPAALFLFVLGARSGGWSHYFLLGQLAGHELEANMWRGFWTFDLGRHVPFAFLGAATAVLAALHRRDRVSAPVLGALATVLVGIGYGSRLHKGGAENVLYPTYAALAILGAIGLAAAWRSADRRPWLSVVASALCLLQFGLLARGFEFERIVPTAQDAERGQRFVSAIHDIEGEVLVSFHGQIAAYAGKRPVAHPITIADVLRTEGGVGDVDDVRDAYRRHLEDVVRSHRFRAIVMEDTVTDAWWKATVEAHYRRRGPLIEDPQYRWIAARGVWPAIVWVPSGGSGK